MFDCSPRHGPGRFIVVIPVLDLDVYFGFGPDGVAGLGFKTGSFNHGSSCFIGAKRIHISIVGLIVSRFWSNKFEKVKEIL